MQINLYILLKCVFLDFLVVIPSLTVQYKPTIKIIDWIIFLSVGKHTKSAGNYNFIPPLYLEVNILLNIFLCSTEERNLYRFGSTWVWVNDDRIHFIFDISLKLHSTCSLISFLASLQPKEAQSYLCSMYVCIAQ